MTSRTGKFAGKKDWISPHKLSLLVLIKCLCRKNDEEFEYSECIARCRQNLSLLLLELLQSPDVDLSEICEKLKYIDVERELHSALLYWLKELMADGVSSIIDFFQSLDDLFSGKEPSLQKISLFGLFVRKMSLLFHKMTFNQVSHFQSLLQDYINSVKRQEEDQDESMESIRSLETDRSKDNGSQNSIAILQPLLQPDMYTFYNNRTQTRYREFMVKLSASSRQAEFFLEKQTMCHSLDSAVDHFTDAIAQPQPHQHASAIQSNEGAALPPSELQKKLFQLLETSSDITEAHFVSYLNCLRVSEFKQAVDSLYHYFDQQQWNTAPQPKGPSDVNELEDERCRRFRYAALNLAALHCRFGHRTEALAALKEAIQIAQETNDHVCLEHCLVWLYRLEQEGSQQATVLLDRFVSRAAELKLPYLTSLSMLTHARHDAITGVPPPKVFLAMSHVNVINSQNSLQDLTAVAHAQHAAIWKCYGKCHIANVFNQLQLNHNNQRQGVLAINDLQNNDDNIQNGEASCLSLCNLAKIHADQGMYQEASEIIKFCKDCFPQPTALSKLWMKTEAIIDHDIALQKGKIEQAEKAVIKLAPLDETEACYRSALNLIHKGSIAEAFPLLQKLLQDCRNSTKTNIDERQKSKAEYHTNVLLALCKLYTVSGNPLAAMPHLLDCLTLACSHYLDHTAALASMCIGHLQLLLGLPAKALVLVKTSMVHLLSHGSLYIQCCAQFLLVKCQLAVALASNSSTMRKQALLSSLPTLDSVFSGFRKLEAMQKVRDVLYQQAKIYDELGYTEARNRCATECCHLLKEQSKYSYSLSVCCF